jgi:hypothetical protein
MKRFFKLHYVPLLLLAAAIAASRLGGNDKAPMLALAAGAVSFAMGLLYLVTLQPVKAFICLAPGLGLAALFILSKLGLVDLMPILGFR